MMVRENKEPPRESKGFDGDKGVNLNEELEASNKAMYETHYPEGTPNEQAIDIRGDAVPEKKG
jgi:hypothetical protein